MRIADTRPAEPVDRPTAASVVADVLDHHGRSVGRLVRKVEPSGNPVTAVPGEPDIQDVSRPDQVPAWLDCDVDAVTGGLLQLSGPEAIEIVRVFDSRGIRSQLIQRKIEMCHWSWFGSAPSDEH